jgi:hypothetical protein
MIPPRLPPQVPSTGYLNKSPSLLGKKIKTLDRMKKTN